MSSHMKQTDIWSIDHLLSAHHIRISVPLSSIPQLPHRALPTPLSFHHIQLLPSAKWALHWLHSQINPSLWGLNNRSLFLQGSISLSVWVNGCFWTIQGTVIDIPRFLRSSLTKVLTFCWVASLMTSLLSHLTSFIVIVVVRFVRYFHLTWMHF